jgi:uncharacterized protein YjbI with pentapeptide repeats
MDGRGAFNPGNYVPRHYGLFAPWLVGGMLLTAFGLGAGWTAARSNDGDARFCSVHTNPVELNGCVVSAQDLDEVDLRGARMRGADLSGVDLSGRNLRGAHMEGAILSGANLAEADLQGAHLNGADIAGATLDGACFYGAEVEGLVGADEPLVAGHESLPC